MAKAPDFQPIINQPGFKAYVPEPIASKTGGASFEAQATLFKDLGKTLVEGNQSFAVEGLKEQTAQHIQDYLASSPTRVKEVQVEAAGLENAMGQFTQVPAPEGVTGDQIDASYSGVQAELNQKLEFLRKARDQGLVTGTDFSERVLKSTREAVAKNPGITRELMSAASQTLELYGIQDRIRRDDALLKAQQDATGKMQTELWNEADKRNIPITYTADGSIDYDTLTRRIMKNRADLGAYQALDQIGKTNTLMDANEVRDITNNGLHYAAVNGAYNDVSGKIIGVFNDPSIPYANKVATAKNIVLEAKGRVRQGFSRYMNDAQMKEAVTFFDTQSDHLVTALESFKSGDDAKKFFANEKTILEDQQNINLLKNVDVASYKFFSNIMQTAGFANLSQTKDGQVFINNLVQLSKNMLADAKPMASDYEKNDTIKDSKFGVLIKQHLEDFAKNDYTKAADFNKIVTGYIKGMNDKEVTPNVQDYFTKSEELVKIMKDPRFNQTLGALDDDARSKVYEVIGTYNDQLASSMSQYIKTHPEQHISLSVLGDGSLVATGGSSEFNRDYVGRINMGLGAYANINGVSKQEASKTFYQEHFRETIMNPEKAGKGATYNNPLNLMKPDGSGIQQYKSFDEGIKATYGQLMNYYNGTGVAGVPRQNVTDIINLWRPESSRKGATDISQGDYISFVAKNIGVTARQRLDLSDPVIMAKLISAMATVEGNPVTYERVFNSLPNKRAMVKNPAAPLSGGSDFPLSDLTKKGNK